jgi:hypothetical protein
MAKKQFHIPENKTPLESHSKLHGIQNMTTLLKRLSQNFFSSDKRVGMYI